MADHMIDDELRVEIDGLGSIKVPNHAYWGASTQRAKENFEVSGKTIGHVRCLVWALGALKKAAAQANAYHGLIDDNVAHAIEQACNEVMHGTFDEHFVVDVIQGGAGTSTNMNANEVIATRATEILRVQHPQASAISALDEVNRSQSTNDVYPTAVKLAVITELFSLQAEYRRLAEAFQDKATEFSSVLKVGRTQLQDAVPMTLGQEFSAFATTLSHEASAIDAVIPALLQTNLGGTAIGTGITSSQAYREAVIRSLNELTGLQFYAATDPIQATSDAGPFLAASAALRQTAVKLSKIANDLRLLSSGPQAGLAEISLPAVQPGSSIMPGKVNPVIPEMVNQVAFKVIGIDTTVTMAAEAGQLQLNAFEPIMTDGLLEAIHLLRNACSTLRTRCITGITANTAVLEQRMAESATIITGLTPAIGYMAAAELASQALQHGGDIVNHAVQRGLLTYQQAKELLSVESLTGNLQPD